MSDNPEQALSYLGWHLIEPMPVLRPYVKSYWVIERQQTLSTLREEFIHPEGGYGIVFNLGDDFYLDGNPLKEQIFLDGSNTVTRRLGFKGQIAALGVRFHTGGAYPFLNIPLHEVANYLVLSDVLPQQSLREVYAQIREAKPLQAKVMYLEGWLVNRLKDYQEAPNVIPTSLEQIENTGGQISMSKLADDLYISQRQLERLYKTQVGMSPVQYARLMRVRDARSLLKADTELSTAQIGATLGFYDQAHFTRDFKSIIGITPHRYRQYSLQKQSDK